MSERKPIGIGVIGLGERKPPGATRGKGHFADSHEEEILDRTASGLYIVRAVADSNPENLRSGDPDYHRTERYVVGGEQDPNGEAWKNVVTHPGVQAVGIFTPDRFHRKQLAYAIEEGVHSFTEKPLAVPEGDDVMSGYHALADSLTEAEEKDLIVSTCHPRRFDPPFMFLKENITDRSSVERDFGVTADLGNVKGFAFNFDYPEPGEEGLHRHPSLMFDHLPHEVDALSFFFGRTGLLETTMHVDNQREYRVTGRRPDGIEFEFHGKRMKPKRTPYKEVMRVQFEHGFIEVDMDKGDATLNYDGRNYNSERPPEDYKTNYDKRFRSLNDHFLRSLTGDEAPYLELDDLRLNTRAAFDLHFDRFY